MSSEPSDTPRRLEDIQTQWSLLRLAHQDVTAAGPARQSLLLRYNTAIRRFVGAVLRNDNDADEVAQEVVVRLMKGDFAGADPTRGRFRDLLRIAIRNMIRNYWSKQNRRAGAHVEIAELPDVSADSDDEWTAAWRRSVLDLTWRSLEDFQNATPGNVFFTILRLRADHPDDDSDQLAERLSQAVGKTYRADNGRQQLRRARVRFAELLLEEVARALASPTPERVEEELLALGLWEYVRDFLPSDWRQTGELTAEPAT